MAGSATAEAVTRRGGAGCPPPFPEKRGADFGRRIRLRGTRSGSEGVVSDSGGSIPPQGHSPRCPAPAPLPRVTWGWPLWAGVAPALAGRGGGQGKGDQEGRPEPSPCSGSAAPKRYRTAQGQNRGQVSASILRGSSPFRSPPSGGLYGRLGDGGRRAALVGGVRIPKEKPGLMP